MKVVVYPADTQGCGHYRMIWPAMFLKQNGYDVDIRMPNQREDIRALISDGEVSDVILPPNVDVIVLQRVTHKFLSQAVPFIREKGIAVVIDMDDDLSRLDPTNPAFIAMHPRGVRQGATNHSWRYAENACHHASMVTVSTVALRGRYMRHGRGAVIHNAVHDEMLSIPHQDSDVFGYPGAVATHRYDVEELGSSVARLMSAGHKFATIGDTQPIKRILALPRDVDIAYGGVELRKWPSTLTKLGVALAPLVDTEFNRAKSWLKPLECAAVGVPCVMSPSAEYQRIHRLGIGRIARNPRGFYTTTRQLLTDATMRNDLSQAGREIAEDHVMSKRAIEWWNVWQAAYDLEQSRS